MRDELDLSAISASYEGEKGQPPYHPAMMTALLLYGYCVGVYSSRRIAKACAERVDFMAIVALDAPDFRTISDFRKRHLQALARLFVQVLKLCERAGLVKLGHVALDGTKIKANASKHKAMSYERMKRAREGAGGGGEALAGGGGGGGRARRTGLRHGQARRRAARLGRRQGRSGWRRSARPRRRWRRRRRQRPRRRPRQRRRPKRSARPKDAKARQAGQAAERRARAQGAAQLHRSRQPHPADQGRLRPGLQRAGGGRWRGAGHRGARD